MKDFKQMEKILLEGDPARKLGSFDNMRLVGDEPRPGAEETTPMSRYPFGYQSAKMMPYGSHQSTNFDRYTRSNVSEKEASESSEQLRRMLRSEVLQRIEALASFYGSDALVKAYDDFFKQMKEKAGIIL